MIANSGSFYFGGKVYNGNKTDLAESETVMLASIFEALLLMPLEFWIDPGDPGEYSGELLKAENEEE